MKITHINPIKLEIESKKKQIKLTLNYKNQDNLLIIFEFHYLLFNTRKIFFQASITF